MNKKKEKRESLRKKSKCYNICKISEFKVRIFLKWEIKTNDLKQIAFIIQLV